MTSLKRSWPVLCMCCLLVFNAMGMTFGLGAIFTDIMDTFRVSRATASLVQSVCFGFCFGSGVFTGRIQQWQGPRVTVITGCVLATAGCVIAFLATGIVQVIVGYGVIAGVGISFNYLTAHIVTGTMFYDVKSLALTVNSVLIAIGTALYPQFLRQLIHHYALRGTFLILAAINCQTILCGVLIGLFTPRTPGKTTVIMEPRKEPQAASEADATVAEAGDEEKYGNSRKPGEDCNREESRHGELVSSVNNIVRSHCVTALAGDDGLSYPVPQRDEKEGDQSIDLNYDDLENSAPYLDTNPSLHNGTTLTPEEIICLMSEKQGPDQNREGALQPLNMLGRVKTTGDHSMSLKDPSVTKGLKNGQSLSSVTFQSSPHCPLSRICNSSCFDKNIFQDTLFVLFVVFGPSSELFFAQPMLFMTDMVKFNRMTAEDGSFFLTIIFLGSLAGRVLAGFLFRLFRSRILYVYSVSIAAGGVTCLFFAFAADYTHFVTVSFILGLNFGLMSATKFMAFLEILGPGRYAIGMSYVATFAGSFLFLAGPYGGLIRDLTESYEPVYYVAAAHGLGAGSLLFVTALRFHHCSELRH